jgi:hypothetical protein
MTVKIQRAVLNCRKRRAARADRPTQPFTFCMSGMNVRVVPGPKPGLWTGTIEDQPIGFTSGESANVAAFIIAAIRVGRGLRRA